MKFPKKDSNYRNKTDKRREMEANDGIMRQVHHMPADSATDLSCGDGSAIIMEKSDHFKLQAKVLERSTTVSK